MEVSEQSRSFEGLLSQQLFGFSEISETLTLRLLDLEERLSKLETANKTTPNVTEESSKELLEASQQRVLYLQGLLNKAPIDYSTSDISKESQQATNSSIDDVLSSADHESVEEEQLPEKTNSEMENNNHVEIKSTFSESGKYLDDQDMPLLSA